MSARVLLRRCGAHRRLAHGVLGACPSAIASPPPCGWSPGHDAAGSGRRPRCAAAGFARLCSRGQDSDCSTSPCTHVMRRTSPDGMAPGGSLLAAVAEFADGPPGRLPGTSSMFGIVVPTGCCARQGVAERASTPRPGRRHRHVEPLGRACSALPSRSGAGRCAPRVRVVPEVQAGHVHL